MTCHDMGGWGGFRVCPPPPPGLSCGPMSFPFAVRLRPPFSFASQPRHKVTHAEGVALGFVNFSRHPAHARFPRVPHAVMDGYICARARARSRVCCSYPPNPTNRQRPSTALQLPVESATCSHHKSSNKQRSRESARHAYPTHTDRQIPKSPAK